MRRPSKLAFNILRSIVLGIALLASACRSAQPPTQVNQKEAGLQGVSAISMLAHPLKDGTVYAGTDGTGLFISNDYGATWTHLEDPNGGIAEATIQTIMARHKDDEITFYVGTWGGGVFRSTDDGETWQEIPNGLVREEDDQVIRALAIGKGNSDGSTVYAGTNSGRVFRLQPTEDGWDGYGQLPDGGSINAMLVTTQGLLVGTDTHGLYMRRYGKTTWESTSKDLDDWRITALVAGLDGLYAGTWQGVYESSDGGATWQKITGFEGNALQVKSLFVHQVEEDELLYVGTQAGLYIWDGTEWRFLNNPLLRRVQETGVIVVSWAADESFLYAGTSGLNGIYRSPDWGLNHWETYQSSVGQGKWLNVRTVVVDSQSGRVFVGTWGSGIYMAAMDSDEIVWINTSSGLNNPYIHALALSITQNDLYAGTWGGGVFRQKAGTSTWQAVNEGLGNLFVSALSTSVGKDGQDVIHAGTWGDGVYTSTNAGTTWHRLPGLEAQKVSALMTDPQAPDQLYVGTKDNGVYRCDTGCESGQWTKLDEGLSQPEVQGFIWTIKKRQILYALVSGQLYWLDGTDTWQAAALSGEDSPVKDFSALGIDPQHLNTIYVVGRTSASYTLDGGGTWKSIPGLKAHVNALAIGHQTGKPVVYAATTRGMRYYSAATKPPVNLVLWALLSGLGLTLTLMLGVMGYAYAVVMRPNQLKISTMLWLLWKPRHLLAASAYQSYTRRWKAGDTLERLILLLPTPADGLFTFTELETTLHSLGAALDTAGLRATLSTLDQRGLLIHENDAWRLAEPLLAQVQCRELPRNESARLAEQTRQEHPRYDEVRRFLARDQAGFDVQPADPFGFLCTSDLPLWAGISPLYVRLVLERALDMKEYQDLYVAAEKAYGGKLRGHTAAVVIDRPPRAADLHLIFALRAQKSLTIIPLPRSLMIQARLDRREMEALKEQVELYTGRIELYDIRTAVTDILSFFGRSGLLTDLERRLTEGRSVVVFGVRKVGKSSLLVRLREECDWSVALVDVQGYTGGLKYVYEKALRGWWAALQAIFPALSLPKWTEDLSKLDPATQAQAFRRAVGDLLDLLENRPGRPGLLLFLDEIEYLFGQPEYLEFAAVLRNVSEDPRCRGRFALLAAGLEPALNRMDRMDGRRNPFFAFFGEVPLGPLEPEDARTMVVSIGGQMGVGYTDEALEILIDAAGGHPFLTRQLCSQAIRDLPRPATVNAAQATQAVDTYLRLARNYLAESLWEMSSNGPPPAEAALLKSLAAAQPQGEEALIPSDLLPEEQRVRQLALDHLHDQSLIRRVESGWELTIPLYRRWIRRYILNLPDEATTEER